MVVHLSDRDWAAVVLAGCFTIVFLLGNAWNWRKIWSGDENALLRLVRVWQPWWPLGDRTLGAFLRGRGVFLAGGLPLCFMMLLIIIADATQASSTIIRVLVGACFVALIGIGALSLITTVLGRPRFLIPPLLRGDAAEIIRRVREQERRAQ